MATGALEAVRPGLQLPPATVAAGGTPEAVRPSDGDEPPGAGIVVGEPALEGDEAGGWTGQCASQGGGLERLGGASAGSRPGALGPGRAGTGLRPDNPDSSVGAAAAIPFGPRAWSDADGPPRLHAALRQFGGGAVQITRRPAGFASCRCGFSRAVRSGPWLGRGSCSGKPGGIRNHLRQLPGARPASETGMQSEKPLSQGLASCNNRTRGHLKRDAERWRRRDRGARVGRG